MPPPGKAGEGVSRVDCLNGGSEQLPKHVLTSMSSCVVMAFHVSAPQDASQQRHHNKNDEQQQFARALLQNLSYPVVPTESDEMGRVNVTSGRLDLGLIDDRYAAL